MCKQEYLLFDYEIRESHCEATKVKIKKVRYIKLYETFANSTTLTDDNNEESECDFSKLKNIKAGTPIKFKPVNGTKECDFILKEGFFYGVTEDEDGYEILELIVGEEGE